MQCFRIYTLVDITRTQVFKEWIDPLKKRQQDNFNTLHQTLEMRGNVYFDEDPIVEELEWNGNRYKTWIWEVYTEQDDIFLFDDDIAGLMKKDIDFVPFNDGCEETVKFKNRFFSISGKDKNIVVEVIDK